MVKLPLKLSKSQVNLLELQNLQFKIMNKNRAMEFIQPRTYPLGHQCYNYIKLFNCIK